jgi:superfamily II DNA or RNA helicase
MARRLRLEAPRDFQETWDALIDIAGRGAGVPPALLAAQVFRVTGGADWPVRRAAMEALIRRARSAQGEQLVVASGPGRGQIWGRYAVGRAAAGSGERGRRKARAPRPYSVALESLLPFAGGCSCPDYLRGSLGMCKHLLAVVGHVVAKPALLITALQGADPDAAPAASLMWDPVRPLRGDGDRLLGIRWIEQPGTRYRAASARRARGHFVVTPKGRVSPEGSARELEMSRALALAEEGVVAATRDKKARGKSRETRLVRPADRGGARAGVPRQAHAIDPGSLIDAPGRHRVLVDLAAAVADTASGVSLDPAVAALVAEELATSTRMIRGRLDTPRLLGHLRSLGRKLYPYQLEGVRRFLEAERLLLADDMGLGKTTQAIAACHALFHEGKIRHGLLIVPAALKSQWAREWEQTTDVPLTTVEGTPEARARTYRAKKAGFLAVGYEQLLKDLPLVHALGPDMVVLDEAQRIKNWATKTAVYVKSLAPRYRLVLTGTPMENRVDELASLLDWVDDIALSPKWRLEPWHSLVEGDGSSGRSGARNLDTLRARIGPCVVRRVRRDVLKQLPSRTDTRVPVAMTPEQQSEHDDLIPSIAALVATAARRPLRQPEFLRLMSLLTTQRILSNGLAQMRFDELWPTISTARPEPALLEGLFAPKLVELRRLVADLVLEQRRKVVIFSQWRRMLRLAAWSVSDLLGDAGLRAAFFTGAESPRLRTQNIVDFHDDPEVCVMFLSDAGGVGLNLQRAASACINLELPWNPAVLEQRIGRIYRLGQKLPIDVFSLVTEYGIEARIATLVATKKALFDGLFDGTTDTVRFEGKVSFLADVEKLVASLPDLPRPQGPLEEETPERDVDLTFEPGDAAADAAAADALVATGSGMLPSPEALAPVLPSLPAARQDGEPPEGAPAPLAAVGSAGLHAGEIRALLGQLSVSRTREGGVSIVAPPDAAASLVALLQGVASLVAMAGSPAPP